MRQNGKGLKEIVFALFSTAIAVEIMKYIGAPDIIFIAIILFFIYEIWRILMKNDKIKKFFWDLVDGKKSWRINVKEVDGCYGREQIVTEIYNYHMATLENKCALLCGFGGTGKTTVAKCFKEMIRCKTNVLLCKREILQGIVAEQISPNTIVFCDYALEAVQSIMKLYSDILRLNKRRITLVLIERNQRDLYLYEQEFRFGKIFNLNDPKYMLAREILKNIIWYNIKDEKKPSDLSGFDEKLNHLVGLVEEKFDKKYKRPLFCVLLAEIYNDDLNTQFDNINGTFELFNRYWATTTREKRVKNFLLQVCRDANFTLYDETEVRRISDKIRNQIKVLTAIASLLSLEFEYSTNELKIYENGIDVSDTYVDLKNTLQHFLEEEPLILRSKLYDYCIFCDYMSGSGRRISQLEYDLVSNWLFIDAVNSENVGIIDLVFQAINKYTNLIHNAFAYAIRSADEMFGGLLVYLSKHVQYGEYNKQDYYRDIWLCIQEMLSAETNNMAKFNACNLVMQQLISNLQKNNIESLEELKEALLELVGSYSYTKTCEVVLEMIEKLGEEHNEKRKG